MARERKQKVQEDETFATPVEVEVKPKWKVLSGGITLLDRRSFTKGDVFEAYEEEISVNFRDIVVKLEDGNVKKKERAKLSYSFQEVVPTAEEQDKEDFVQLYEIVNSNGKVISAKPMPLSEVEPLVKELNG